MLKKIIIIENESKIQCDTEKEVIENLIDENYYKLTKEEKIKIMKMKAILNSINNKMEIIEANEIKQNIDLNNKFILLDEKTYVLSLLMANKIILLERKDSNIYTSYLDKSKFTKNYIIVNNFANEILQNYIKDKLQN